jgi:hypothetical protein
LERSARAAWAGAVQNGWGLLKKADLGSMPSRFLRHSFSQKRAKPGFSSNFDAFAIHSYASS